MKVQRVWPSFVLFRPSDPFSIPLPVVLYIPAGRCDGGLLGAPSQPIPAVQPATAATAAAAATLAELRSPDQWRC